MRQQGVDEAQSIRTERQAEQGAVGAEAIFTNAVRTTSSTSGSFTADTRAVRQSAVGFAGDLFFESDTGLVYYADTGTSWKYLAGIGFGSNATRAGLTISTDDNGAWFFVTDAGINYGLWRVVSGGWVKELLPASPDVLTEYRVNGNRVVNARKTGWTTATGTATRSGFDTTTVTLPQLAEAVKALIDDLHQTAGHGLIGT